MKGKGSAKYTARLSVLLCLALLMGYIEHLTAFDVGVPGVKAGFAHIVVLFTLYRYGVSMAFGVNLCRIGLSALLFGNAVSAFYGVCGGLLAFFVMWLLKKINLFGVVGVSALGAVCHNMAQLGAAALLSGTVYVFSYAPVLLVAGTVFGALTGLLCLFLLKKIPENL